MQKKIKKVSVVLMIVGYLLFLFSTVVFTLAESEDESLELLNDVLNPIEWTNESEGKNASMESKSTMFFVGGSGPANYSSIQSAIDNASDNDTVFVYSGLYSENILINKNISVIGEQKSSTIIDGSGGSVAVTIGNGMVLFDSFSVQFGIDYGIRIDNAHQAIVNNTLIQHNGNAGIYASSAIGCRILNCTISTHTMGIEMDQFSRFCTIRNCSVLSHSSRAMFFKDTYENNIIDCLIQNNYAGIILHDSNHSLIQDNVIENTSSHAMKLKDASGNLIKSNTITLANEGIQLFEQSTNNHIVANSVRPLTNQQPFAIDDAASTQMNTMVSIDVTANDFDGDGKINTSSLFIEQYPLHGSVIVSGRFIEYTPDTGFNGTDIVQYRVSDDQSSLSNIASVTIYVISDSLGEELDINQSIQHRSLPVYADNQLAQSFRSQAGIFTHLELMVKKTGTPPADLSIEIHKDNITGDIVFSDSKPANMINITFDWIVFDDADFSMIANVQYFIVINTISGSSSHAYHWAHSNFDTYGPGRGFGSDDDGASWDPLNTSDFCFRTFKQSGIAPLSVNDTYLAVSGKTLTIGPPGVLANDHDPDMSPQPVSAQLISTVSHGSLSLQSNGGFSYTPQWDFTGVDQFTYIASDGAYDSTISTVTFDVSDNISYVMNIPYSASTTADNIIYHNSFFGKSFLPLVIDSYQNNWDNTTIMARGGNYWSNFNEPGEGAFDADFDNCYDNSYSIDSDSIDSFPLVMEWNSFDPLANFSWIPIGPATDLRMKFTDQSLDFGYGLIVNWSWDFGDGNYSFDQHPTHQYDHIGIYPVTLSITDDDGLIDEITKQVTISASDPYANFTFNPDSPFTSDVIQFTDLSVDDGDIVSWLWQFGDGNTSVIQHPSHQYADNGQYNITLTVGDDDGATDSVTKIISVFNVAPVLLNDSVVTIENIGIWIPVTANDGDSDGFLDLSTLSIIVNPLFGITNVNTTTGEIRYIPNTNFYGNDSFWYEIADDDGAFSNAKVDIEVIHVNQPPLAFNDSYSGVEDDILQISAPGVLQNDSDPDGYLGNLTAVLINDTSQGSVILSSNGSFIYTPDPNVHGMDSFTYQAFDGLNYSNTATVTLQISNINDAPFANDDYYMLDEDSLFWNASVSVLDNDIDSDNSTTDLSIIMVDNVSHGSLLLYSNGSFMYQPMDNFSGVDSFTYQAFDGLNYSNIATVSLHVTNINDAPIAVNDSYMVLEDDSLSVPAPGVLINDFDSDSSTLQAVLILGPVHGNLTMYSDGGFEYTPNPDFYGFDSFTYQAYDGINASNTATVTIQVINENEHPIAFDDHFMVTESVSETIGLMVVSPGVLVNDTDSDGPSALTSVLFSSVSHGILTLNSDGSFWYQSNDNFTGTDQFSYQAFDGANYSNTALVNITVSNVNDPPVAVNNQYSILEDESLDVVAPGVLSNDIDAESLIEDLQAVLVSSVSNGSLSFYSNGSFSFVPDPQFHGIDQFSYQAFDGINYSNTAIVTIIVQDVNDVPVAFDDSYATEKNTPLYIPAPGVLVNDTDPDASPHNLSVVLVDGAVKGSVTLLMNGSFLFTPLAGYVGPDQFTYQAFDGLDYSNIATVSLLVLDANDAPIAHNDSYATIVNQTLQVVPPGVLFNDFDPDNGPNPLVAVLNETVTHGSLDFNASGNFTYIPNTNYSGNDSFTYSVFDGESYSNQATVMLSIVLMNNPPVAYDDLFYALQDHSLFVDAPGVLANDTDDGVGSLSAMLVSDVSEGVLTLNANGSFSYVPDAGWAGSDFFTYQAFDGMSYSNIAIVEINTLLENIVPIAVNDSFMIMENSLLTQSAPGVLQNDYDSDSGPDDLTMQLINSVSYGSLSWHVNGSFSYLPSLNFSGVDSFSYRAFDGLNTSNTAVVTITVENSNQPPIAVNDSFTLNEDTSLLVSSPGLLANDFDPDNGPDELSVVLVDSVNHGTLSLNADGSFSYQPDIDFAGVDQFTYQAFDAESYSNVTLVTLIITGVNDAPVAVNDSVAVLLNDQIDIAVTVNDFDIDGLIDLSSVNVTSGPSNGTVMVFSNGSIRYTPNVNFSGFDEFQYTITDDLGALSNQAVVNISVVSDYLDVNQSDYDRGFPIRAAIDGDWAAAQSFQPGLNTITRLSIYLRRFGSPMFDLTVELRENAVNGTLLDTLVFTPAEIASSWQWVTIDVIDIVVDPNVTYFIVCPPAPMGVTTSFGYEWGYAFGNVYADGDFWFTRDGGLLWRALPGSYEFSFRSYGIVSP